MTLSGTTSGLQIFFSALHMYPGRSSYLERMEDFSTIESHFYIFFFLKAQP